MKAPSFSHTVPVPEFLAGGGEMGQRIREFDWSKTSLGPVETWPQSLRTCIRIMLTSRQPIWIGWGKELIKFYNDPYKAIVGGKHPWALGSPASVVWKDIWHDIEPMLTQVMEKDEGTYVESQLLIMVRNGYPEETYYTFSYTPIPGDDGKTAGMFCANTDDTDRIISERQLKTLTQLGKRLTDCHTNEEVVERTISTLHENPYDFPFALFRKIENRKAILVKSTPMGNSSHLVKSEIDLENDSGVVAEIIQQTIHTRSIQVLSGITQKVGQLPMGSWGVPPDKAIVLPILHSVSKEPYGMLVIGLNPYRLLDEKYRAFFSLVSDQVATSLADVHVLEEERKRVKALAEIDKAKTIFFSNISHEFRTPLTLLLGPLEDAMNDPDPAGNRQRLDMAYRNALRMQKLVNTLLEFSRIEAGRLHGRFTKVDIAAFTGDLASTFRSAIEQAGMALEFSHTPVPADVYVDLDMWEKIVLNLLSNAFKYTLQGKISVSIGQENDHIRLDVADTGMGIPEDQLEKIFERFHRVENTQGRSGEGTGIGLSMVKELVHLHHGRIGVQSAPGKGSVFTVTIPAGKAHLANERVDEAASASVSQSANAFVHEALKWIPEKQTDSAAGATRQPADPAKPTVLLADDNADMRDYVCRLLEDDFTVIAASDGEDAYNKLVQHHPALLISDMMMPKLSGFELLKKVREHSSLRNLPVIFLSARAGEEAKVEGLEAGADDYLVKPFSGKELLVRVHNRIRMGQVRRQTEQQFYQLFLQAPAMIHVLKGPDHEFEFFHPKGKDISGGRDLTGQKVREALPQYEGQGFFEVLDEVYREGKTVVMNEKAVVITDGTGEQSERYYNFIYQPWRDLQGKIEGVLNFGVEVTESVRAKQMLVESEQYFRKLADSVPAILWMTDKDGYCVYLNKSWYSATGQRPEEAMGMGWLNAVHADDMEKASAIFLDANTRHVPFHILYRLRQKDGHYRWSIDSGSPRFDEEGKFKGFIGSVIDVHDAKTAEDKIRESEIQHRQTLEEEVRKRTAELNELNNSLQRSNNELQQFAHVASHDLKEPLRKIKIFADIVARESQNVFTDRSKTFIDKINSASDRLLTMVEGVLNYSVINGNEQEIGPVNLNATIKSIETDLEIPFAQKKASIVYKNLPTIEGSSVLLYQLFYNLINNSLKFAKPGVAPVITVSSDLIAQHGKECVWLTLQDNGLGFEPQYSERIFESFARLNSKDQFEGTGLGLALCKRIAERHGGHIEATGTPGEGAIFTLVLPVTQTASSI